MSGHTPGPWRVPKHAPFQVEQENALLGSAVLAEVHAWEAGGRSKAERDANARLIAAAPELYEAAKALHDIFEGDEPFLNKVDLLIALGKASRAIDKAQGQS